MNAALTATPTPTAVVTADDVIREGNIKVILPWDNRVGEIWDAGSHPTRGQVFGLAGLNGDRVPARAAFTAEWEYVAEMYSWHGAAIRRAPSGAEPGDLVTA